MLASTRFQTGPPGETGNKGPEGGRGQQGKEGKPGQQGPRGMQGDMGVPGLPGVQGQAVRRFGSFLRLHFPKFVGLFFQIYKIKCAHFRENRRLTLTLNKSA